VSDNYQYIPPEDVYPMWETAVEKIRERFENESYGLIITHEEFKGWMGIQSAKTLSEVQKEQLDYLTGIEKTKKVLLEDYNLCLYRIQGIGYQILHPKEQIRVGADYYFKKSQKSLSRSMNILANVDQNLLDFESRELQLAKIARTAWIKSAFRRKKLPNAHQPKQINETNN